MANNVKDVFERIVSKYPKNTALVCGAETISYEALNAMANKLADYLIGEGVSAGDRVAVLISRSEYLVISILAVVKTGATYVPIDDKSPQGRIDHIVRTSNIALLLANENCDCELPKGHKTIDPVAICNSSLFSLDDPNVEISEESVAYIIYTSGSTGVPNGVQVKHQNLFRLFEITKQNFTFSEKDVWSLFHSIGFDFSVWEMWGALLFGGELVVVPYWVTRSPEDFYDLLVNQGVTVLNQTSSAFRNIDALLEGSDKPKLSSLRYIIFGGESLNKGVLKRWVGNYGVNSPQIINMYGITETTVHVTYHQLDYPDFFDDSDIIGQPLADLKIHLLDSNHKPVLEGDVGEMYVEGAGVTAGYCNNSELSAERFLFLEGIDSVVYKTGDLARLNKGNFEYRGRCDSQVKIRGFRIELGEVESRIRLLDDIKEVCVFPGGKGDTEHLVAIVDTARQLDVKKTKTQLREFLPEYMIPSKIIQQSIPITNNGKVDRKFLENRLSDLLSAGHGAVSAIDDKGASNQNQRHDVYSLICSVIGVAEIDENRTFLDVGGNSLLAVKLLSALKRELNISLEMQDLFAKPFIELFSTVDESRSSDQEVGRDKNSSSSLVLGTVRKVLASDDISESDMFLDVGGNSLLAVKVINYLQSEHQTTISIEDLFGKKMGEIAACKASNVTESPRQESTAIEQKFLDVVETTLGEKAVDLNMTFLDAGGNSLLAVKVLSRLKNELSIEVDIADLFQFPLRHLISQVEEHGGVEVGEQRFVELFDSMLGEKSANPNHTFLDAGGNSLLAVKAIKQINAEFGVDIPIYDLFEKTIGALYRDYIDMVLNSSKPQSSAELTEEMLDSVVA
ncbi:amino acid adenylation domain-containing protein [Alteromonadaceae bacterium 2753L.S.0a.02]|nr:amino acid adenylation domain-containing protein [Alteromonadaceae bacterium 2753L.S.0a.02]